MAVELEKAALATGERHIAKFSLDDDSVMASRFEEWAPHMIHYDESLVVGIDTTKNKMTDETIRHYVKDYMKPQSTEVTSDYLMTKARDLDLVMAYIGPEDAILYQEYLKATRNNRIRQLYNFFHTFDFKNVDFSEVAENDAPAIVLLRHFNDPVVYYQGPMTSLDITVFAHAKSQPLVQKFTTDTAHQIFNEMRPAIILFENGNEFLTRFTEAAKFFEEKFLFVKCRTNSEPGSMEDRLVKLVGAVLSE